MTPASLLLLSLRRMLRSWGLSEDFPPTVGPSLGTCPVCITLPGCLSDLCPFPAALTPSPCSTPEPAPRPHLTGPLDHQEVTLVIPFHVPHPVPLGPYWPPSLTPPPHLPPSQAPQLPLQGPSSLTGGAPQDLRQPPSHLLCPLLLGPLLPGLSVPSQQRCLALPPHLMLSAKSQALHCSPLSSSLPLCPPPSSPPRVTAQLPFL